MEFCPFSRDYDVYIVMCQLENLRQVDLWRIYQLGGEQQRHRDGSNDQKNHEEEHQFKTESEIQSQCPSDVAGQIGVCERDQNVKGLHQVKDGLSGHCRDTLASGAITQLTELIHSNAQSHYPLMTTDGEHRGSQTMVKMFPCNIVSQRLLSGKPPLRADRFPKVCDDQEETEESTSSKSEPAVSLNKSIKLENHRATKIPSPFKQLYTFVKRISVSTGSISTQSKGNKSKSFTTLSDSIKWRKGRSISETQTVQSDIKAVSKNTKGSTGAVSLPSRCKRSCATEGNAFKCCTCGRIIILKRRSNRNLFSERTGKAESGSHVVKTDRKRPGGPCTHHQNVQPSHVEVTSSFKMAAYDVFSLACLLMIIPTLYTAFNFGVFDGVMDYKTEGAQKEFYCLVGLCVVARLTWHYAWKFWNRYFAALDESFFEAEVWAVITGCTNGIGKEYARQLAAKNLNVILISRDAHLLMELAREISNEYRVRTVTLQADFSSGDQDLYDMLEARLKGYEIVILVNNVGTSHDTLDRFHVNTPDALITTLINVNMVSMAKMSKMLLPGMLARRRGVIINVSSAFGRNPAPYLAMYGATKSFADYFSRALQKEYGKYHIAVQSLTPYVVSTNMTKNAPPTMLIPSAETFVRSALNTVGLESRTHGYLPHSVMGTILDNAPSWVRFYYMKFFRYRASKLAESHQHN